MTTERETLSDAQADALIEAVGERMGMHQGAWDMVDGRELARAFVAELRATPPAGPVVRVARDENVGGGGTWLYDRDPAIPVTQMGVVRSLLPESVAAALGLAPGECKRFRLSVEGASDAE